MRLLIAFILSFILLCNTDRAPGLEPATRITQYGHTARRLGLSGLASVPYAVAQTPDGYIWVGTDNGLFRFDGVRFSRWIPPDGEEFTDSFVDFLFASSGGDLYVGTDTGLTRLTRGHLYHYPETLHWPGPFLEDSQGTVWMGHFGTRSPSSMLCRVGRNNLACFGTKDGFGCSHAQALASDKQGSIWIGSDEGVCRWQQAKKPENYLLPYLSMPNVADTGVNALAADGKGSLWAGVPTVGNGCGLLKFTDGTWKTYITPEVDGRQIPVSSLLFDRQGSLWIGTPNKGLYRLFNGKLDHFGAVDGLSSDTVKKMFEDKEGNLWVVTTEGLDTFRDLPVLSFTSREGLSDNSPSLVTTTREGDVWVGTNSSLNRLHQNQFSSIDSKHGLPSIGGITYLFRDSQDRLWVGGAWSLYLYKGGHFNPVTGPKGEPVGYVQAMVEDVHHRLWVSAVEKEARRGVLARIQDLHIAESFPVPSNLKNLTSLAPDPDGMLWVGTSTDGLFRFRGRKLDPVEPSIFAGGIRRLAAEADGSLWITTVRQGILRYQSGRAQALTKQNGLPCDSGYGIANDQSGSHWFYMECGIIRISDDDLANWWKNPSYHVKTTVFGLLDRAQPMLAYGPPAFTPDGRLWSVNGNSVQVIDPKHLPHNPLPPPVHVERLIVDHTDYSVSGSIKIPASPREVEIDYVGLSYVVPEKVQFRYRLTGYQKQWTDAGTRRQAFYNDLAPGHYTFQVIACNNDGDWNIEGATFHFTIPPAWYQTVWFRLFCVLSVFALGYSLYLLRLRQYAVWMRMRFDERLEERTRLARDLHDTLLQSIQGSKLVADLARETVQDSVRTDKSLMRLSEWLGRAIVEGRVALESLRSSTTGGNDLAEEFRSCFDECTLNGDIEISLAVSGTGGEMHPIAREEVFRMGYEAIRNACAHSGGMHVRVELVYDQNLLVRIIDDGHGMDPELLRRGKSGHYGLAGMRERAARIGVKLTVSSSLQGTEVSLFVPGEVIFESKKETRLARFLKSFLRPKAFEEV